MACSRILYYFRTAPEPYLSDETFHRRAFYLLFPVSAPATGNPHRPGLLHAGSDGPKNGLSLCAGSFVGRDPGVDPLCDNLYVSPATATGAKGVAGPDPLPGAHGFQVLYTMDSCDYRSFR